MHAESPAGDLRLADEPFRSGLIREKRYPGDLRSNGFEKFQPLGCQLGSHAGQPGDVSAWLRKARYDTATHRVAAEGHDDRNGLGRSLCSPNRLGRRSDDHVDVESNQLIGEVGKLLEPSLGISGLDHDVLPLNVTDLAQAVTECFFTS